ncbi:MAG: methyltransferase [Desulfurococcaceae archaeon]
MFKYPLLKYMGNVYRPSDDTWLLINTLEKRKPRGDLCIDLGAGSGVLGLFALLNELCIRVVFIDIMEDAVETISLNIQLNDVSSRSIIVLSDGVIVHEEYAEIVFANPPYLPVHDPMYLDPATGGGLEGYEAILYFIDYAKSSLKKNGLLYLVYSSLSKPSVVLKYLRKSGFKVKYTESKHFFFETIYVAECVKSW